MEGERFDRWVKGLTTGADRRAVLKGLAASLATGSLVRVNERAAAAPPCKPIGRRCQPGRTICCGSATCDPGTRKCADSNNCTQADNIAACQNQPACVNNLDGQGNVSTTAINRCGQRVQCCPSACECHASLVNAANGPIVCGTGTFETTACASTNTNCHFYACCPSGEFCQAGEQCMKYCSAPPEAV